MAQTNESQEQVTVNVETLQPVTRTLMTIGALPTSYLISMTYEEQLLWLQNYLIKTVIPAINNNAEATQEVQDIVMALQQYINDYFNNLDVQEEINNKLDEMAQDGSLTTLIENYVNPYIQAQNQEISNFKTHVNEQISLQNAQIQAVTSGSPLVASSVSEMTDTTRVYVNTTDGNWYYYNGTAWTIGGQYQSTGIAKNSITKDKTTFFSKINMLPETGWIKDKALDNNVTNLVGANYHPDFIEVNPSKKYYSLNYNKYISWNGKIQIYDENQTRLGFQVLNSRNTAITLSSNAKYIRFTFLNNDFEVLPDNAPVFIDEDTLLNLKNYYYVDVINQDNIGVIDETNIIFNVNKKVHFLPYGAGNGDVLPSFNNIYNVERTITTTSDHLYSGFNCIADNISVGDKINIDILDTTLENLVEIRASVYQDNGFGTTLATFNHISGSLYSIEVTSDFLARLVNNKFTIYFVFTGLTGETEILMHINIYVNDEYTDISSFNNRINHLTEIIDDNKTYKALFLGDSITAMSGPQATYPNGWITHFKSLIPLSYIKNVAENGAQLQDKENTPEYTGETNPSDALNVLGNQVTRVLNDTAIETPDIIMIAIGTNGGINVTTDDDIYNCYYINNNVVSLDDVNRKTSAGAFRWCLEKLHNKFPNALIIWCAPIHKGGNNYKNVVTWYNNLKQFCNTAGVYCIDSLNCGIQSNGSGNFTEFLHDNLHPNEKGAKLLGYYNACKVKEILNLIQ